MTASGPMAASGAMAGPVCGAAAFLRSGGPAQVPFRPCCAAALLHAARAAESPAPSCPRRGELVVAGEPLLALASVTVGTGWVESSMDMWPSAVGPGGEVVP